MDMFNQIRNSRILAEEVYFWTNTVHQWKMLLEPDKYKDVILDSLNWLVQRGKIKVYGFVVMPNHLHLLWEMIEKNGKEMPYASFQKYTAHMIQKDLIMHHPDVLSRFAVDEKERKYRFWQRDPLAIKIENRMMIEQKLDYLHSNPLQSHWNLAQRPERYYYSSARFYETGACDVEFITHYKERF